MKGGFCGFSLLHGKHCKQNFCASALQFCQIDKKHQTVAQIAYTTDVVQKFVVFLSYTANIAKKVFVHLHCNFAKLTKNTQRLHKLRTRRRCVEIFCCK